jgi:hypothetical protein
LAQEDPDHGSLLQLPIFISTGRLKPQGFFITAQGVQGRGQRAADDDPDHLLRAHSLTRNTKHKNHPTELTKDSYRVREEEIVGPTRKSMRYPVKARVSFWWKDEDGNQRQGEGISRDISETAFESALEGTALVTLGHA